MAKDNRVREAPWQLFWPWNTGYTGAPPGQDSHLYGFDPFSMGYTGKEDPNHPVVRGPDGYPIAPETRSGVWRPSDEPAKKKD